MSFLKTQRLFLIVLFLNLFATLYILNTEVLSLSLNIAVIPYALTSLLLFIVVLENCRRRLVYHIFTLMVGIAVMAISVVYLITTQEATAGQAIQRIWPLFIILAIILDAYLQSHLKMRSIHSPRAYALWLIYDRPLRLYWFLLPIGLWVFTKYQSTHWEIVVWNLILTSVIFLAVIFYLGHDGLDYSHVPFNGVRPWAINSFPTDADQPTTITLLKWSLLDGLGIVYVYTLISNLGLFTLLPPELQTASFWWQNGALLTSCLLAFRSWDNPHASVWTRQPE